jgi:hypothetical protein
MRVHLASAYPDRCLPHTYGGGVPDLLCDDRGDLRVDLVLDHPDRYFIGIVHYIVSS